MMNLMACTPRAGHRDRNRQNGAHQLRGASLAVETEGREDVRA